MGSLLNRWRYTRALARQRSERFAIERPLVVLSGGLDSATALYKAIEDYKLRPIAVSFLYGSKHSDNEMTCAKWLCTKNRLQRVVIDLCSVTEHFKSALLQDGEAIPDGHYAHDTMKSTVVPFRNGIMLSVAAGLAESLSCQSVIIGSHAGDHAIYPDCRQSFTEPMAEAMFSGTYKNIRLERPFEHLTKAEIIMLGREMRVPYGMTWSCYKGGAKSCGRCGTCTERLQAFDEASTIDPLQYEDRDFWRTVV